MTPYKKKPFSPDEHLQLDICFHRDMTQNSLRFEDSHEQFWLDIRIVHAVAKEKSNREDYIALLYVH